MAATGGMGVLEAINVSEAELESTLAVRERYDDAPALESGRPGVLTPDELARITDAEIRSMVSTEAYQKTISFETGGRGYYDKRLRWPTWPGASSGITIGIGYDLGYHRQDEVRDSWGDLLLSAHMQRLMSQVGFKTDGSGSARETKVSIAKQRAEELRRAGIEIPWETAEIVFVRATLPKYARMVLASLPHARELSPDSFGALFSLVFNRGASFYNDGDRFKEMRNIARHMMARELDRIPGELRAMKRIWGPELSGLHKRRDAEADLFERGLAAPKVVATPAPAPVPQPDPVPRPQPDAPVAAVDTLLTPVVGFEAARATSPVGEAEEDLFDREASGPGLAAEAAGGPSPEEVRWPSDPALSADYRHLLDRDVTGQRFSFSAKDLELLVRANRFALQTGTGRVLFALRGCRLAGDSAQMQTDQLELIETRPDHRQFRCVIGVWDTARGWLSGFPGSTVPEYTSVIGGWQKARRTPKELNGNLLTTGCYPYFVGTHGSKRRVAGCFLQGVGEGERAYVVVQRTHKDVVYDLDDMWHACQPHDNLHPAFRESGRGFSSEGCLTVRGNVANGVATGDFAAFRQRAGDGAPPPDGTRFDLVLLTGLEAAIAANLRERGLAGDEGFVLEQLGRLRQGSAGEEVTRLQRALGRPETGVLGADDRIALINAQRASRQPADGIFSPFWDRHLGFAAFRAPAILVASAESAGFGRRPVTDDRTSPSLSDHLSRARAEALAKAGEDSLLYEIGLRAQIAADRPQAALESQVSANGLAGAELGMSDLRAIGRRILARLERDLYQTLCGQDPADEQARQQMAAVLAGALRPVADTGGAAGSRVASASDPEVVMGLSRSLVASMGIMPVLAQPLAALLLGRVAAASMDETCRAWSVRFGPVPGSAMPPGGGSPPVQIATRGSAAAISAAEVARALSAGNDDLLREIGRNAPREAGAAMSLPGGAVPEGIIADIFGQSVEDAGRRWLERAEEQLHRILCGNGAEEQSIRDEAAGLVADAFDVSDRSRAVRSVATLLVTYAGAGFLPALAIPIAAYVVANVLKAGQEETCTYWSQSLASRIAARQAVRLRA